MSELLRPRHSLAHCLAQAVQRRIEPQAALGIGPAIDTGFYYDFTFSSQFSEENLKPLTDEIRKILKEKQIFLCHETDLAGAREILDFLDSHLANQKFKKILLDRFESEGETRFTFFANAIAAPAAERLLADAHPDYRTAYQAITDFFLAREPDRAGKFITFIDLCEGPHVGDTSQIPDGSFTLDKIAGAYRAGDEKNPMMTRIYGLAFDSKNSLREFLELREEAKRRDHRVLGQKLKLFTISPLIGAGLPLMQPRGMVIRREIEEFLRELHREHGYERVRTPHLARQELYETSGHAEKFGDELFRVQGQDEEFFLKPMNCPHHMQIFADNHRSYRDLPVRYFEPGTVYRDEKTGQLSGLTRVRAITQDDGHIFCRIDQI